MSNDVLFEIAERAGVQRGFTDARGERVESPVDSIATVLGCFGYDVSSDAKRQETLARLRGDDDRLVAATIPVEAGEHVVVPVRAEAGEFEWRLCLENGTERQGRSSVARNGGTSSIVIDDVPQGYHRLHLRAGDRSAEAWLIAAPPTCFLPEALSGDTKAYGITAQVYGLRSSRNFGIGDLGDV